MKKTINFTIWILQVSLAIILLWAGYTKLFTSKDQLALMWPWTESNAQLLTLVAICDILGGIGIIIPRILQWNTKWTLFTSIGIICLMISAAVFHILRNEHADIGINLFIIVLALCIVFAIVKQKKKQLD